MLEKDGAGSFIHHAPARGRFEETDLYQLSGMQRAAAINALVSGAALPFVIVGERVVCTGSLDLEVLTTALEQSG